MRTIENLQKLSEELADLYDVDYNLSLEYSYIPADDIAGYYWTVKFEFIHPDPVREAWDCALYSLKDLVPFIHIGNSDKSMLTCIKWLQDDLLLEIQKKKIIKK